MQKHKTLIAVIAVLTFVALGFAWGLDEWIHVRWDASVGEAGPKYKITDAGMSGLQDSSILYPIPPGAQGMEIMVRADTGTTSILIADDDSLLLWGNLLPITGSWANAVLFDAIADSFISGANADSFASWGVGTKIAYVPDTFAVTIAFPPADSVGTPKIVGGRDFMDYAYVGLRLRVTDSTGVGGVADVWIKFHSEKYGWFR